MEGEDEEGRWVEGRNVRVELIFGGDFEDFRHGGLGVGVLVVCVNGGVTSRAQRALLDVIRVAYVISDVRINFVDAKRGLVVE